jgi:hypothetical protein
VCSVCTSHSRKPLQPTSHIHLDQVLLWLLAMLDLAVEYKEHSKMGYAEFAAVSADTAPG